MTEREDRAGLVGEFLSSSLGKREVSFLYLGYAGIILRMEGGVVAFDVANLLGSAEIAAVSKLDLLFYTHSHSDHYNRAPTRKLVKGTDVHIVAQQQVAEDLSGRVPPDRLTVAEPGKTISVAGFEVDVVEGVHPRPISIGRIKKGDLSVFHAGDSGYVPVRRYAAQVAFLPTGRPSPSCSPESALDFTLDLRPRVAVAMHGHKTQLTKFSTEISR
jgi:L-ascorbate metabolism protein UlaG (beta-lactamase superfamily)